MNLKTIAFGLIGLVIVGLLMFAIIGDVIPAVFEYISCAATSFLSPGGGEDGLAACADEFEINFGN